MKQDRALRDLNSVGPATLGDFEDLGITEVEQLVNKDAIDLIFQLEEIKGQKLDPCCEDVFRCAIEQARNPGLSKKKKNWYYWSKVRKQRSARKL